MSTSRLRWLSRWRVLCRTASAVPWNHSGLSSVCSAASTVTNAELNTSNLYVIDRCLFRLSELYCVSTKMRRSPGFRQLLIGMSISRYLPPIGTAGFERWCVRGNRRVPRPPPRMTAMHSFMRGHSATRARAAVKAAVALLVWPLHGPRGGRARGSTAGLVATRRRGSLARARGLRVPAVPPPAVAARGAARARRDAARRRLRAPGHAAGAARGGRDPARAGPHPRVDRAAGERAVVDRDGRGGCVPGTRGGARARGAVARPPLAPRRGAR